MAQTEEEYVKGLTGLGRIGIAKQDVRDYTCAFETKAPDYFRVDLGVSFRKNKLNWSWVVTLDLQNAPTVKILEMRTTPPRQEMLSFRI